MKNKIVATALLVASVSLLGYQAVFGQTSAPKSSDVNGDGCVDMKDMLIVKAQVDARSTNLAYDINGDGKVDIADVRYVVVHFDVPGGSHFTPCPFKSVPKQV